MTLPGVRTAIETTSRSVLMAGGPAAGELRMPRQYVMEKDLCFDVRGGSPYAIMQPGNILGKSDTSGKWGPAIYGTIGGGAGPAGNYAAADVDIWVSPAVANELLRLVAAGVITLGAADNMTFIGAPTAAGVVAVIDGAVTAIAATGEMTLNAALGADMVLGSYVVPIDGEGLDDAGDGGIGNGLIVLGDGDGSGISMLSPDDMTTRIDMPASPALVGGCLKTADINNYPVATNTTLVAYLKARLRAAGQQFIFDDEL